MKIPIPPRNSTPEISDSRGFVATFGPRVMEFSGRKKILRRNRDRLSLLVTNVGGAPFVLHCSKGRTRKPFQYTVTPRGIQVKGSGPLSVREWWAWPQRRGATVKLRIVERFLLRKSAPR